MLFDAMDLLMIFKEIFLMNKSIFVRIAKEEDAHAISAVTREAFKTYAENTKRFDIDALNEKIETVSEDIKSKIVLAAVDEDVIIGSVRVEIRRDSTAYLSRLGVIESYRRRGIGGSLISAVDDIMNKNNISRIYLHTSAKFTKLVVFYYLHGFYIESVDWSLGYPRASFIKEYRKIIRS